MLVATVAGALLLARRRLPWLKGAERVVAVGVLATTGVLFAHMVPGVLGLLGRGSVFIASLVWLAASALIPAAEPEPDPLGPNTGPADPGSRYSMPVAVVVAGAVALLFVAFGRDQLTVPSGSVDFNSFHMPDVVRWIQTGSLWQVPAFLPGVSPGNYPNNGDVLLLAFSLPWHNDFAVRAPIYAAFALTGVATYALALRVQAPRAAAIVAGALICAVPAVVISALTHAITDSVALFGFAAALLFLVRHHRSGRLSDLTLAGLGLGISFGTKWYAVSGVAVVVGVWAIASLAGGTRSRTIARHGLFLCGLIALTGGFWLLRNWVESGNPFFPVRLAPLGVTIFDAPYDEVRARAGYTIAHYLTDAQAWKDFIFPQYRHALAAPAGLALVGALVAGGVLVARRHRGVPSRGPLLAGLACAVVLIAVYIGTPYTAGGPEDFPILVGADSRYVVPALLICVVLAAWVSGKAAWGSVGFAVLGLAAVLHGMGWATRGELSGVRFGLGDWVEGTVILVAVALGAWVVVRVVRSRPSSEQTAVVYGVLGVAGLALLVGGYEVQKRFNDDRFALGEPVIDKVVRDASADRRIGLAGVWTDQGLAPILPSFGPRFENDVEYVGPIVREQLRRYEDPASFRQALRAGQFDLLIVGRGRPELPPPEEGAWAADAGFKLIARSDRLELYAPG